MAPRTHRLHSLQILFHLVGRCAIHCIPILRGNNRHLHQTKILIQLIPGGRGARAAVKNPRDYTARSNLMWDATIAENRIIKMGKKGDFQCHNMDHQLGAYANCNHGQGLAVLHPIYYRYIYQEGLPKFVRFAENVWGLSPDGKSEEQLAEAGIQALAAFVRELGLPTTLRELGLRDKGQLRDIANSCAIAAGSYKKLTHDEIFDIFNEAW